MTDSQSEYVKWLFRNHEESQRLDAAAAEHNRLLAALEVEVGERQVRELRERLQGQTKALPSKSQAMPRIGQRAELPAATPGISDEQLQALASEMGGAIKGIGEVIAGALKDQPAPEVYVTVEQPKKTAKVIRDKAGLITSITHVDEE
jgi:hypothetical protein